MSGIIVLADLVFFALSGQWVGIAVAVLAVVLYLAEERFRPRPKPQPYGQDSARSLFLSLLLWLSPLFLIGGGLVALNLGVDWAARVAAGGVGLLTVGWLVGWYFAGDFGAGD